MQIVFAKMKPCWFWWSSQRCHPTNYNMWILSKFTEESVTANSLRPSYFAIGAVEGVTVYCTARTWKKRSDFPILTLTTFVHHYFIINNHETTNDKASFFLQKSALTESMMTRHSVSLNVIPMLQSFNEMYSMIFNALKQYHSYGPLKK